MTPRAQASTIYVIIHKHSQKTRPVVVEKMLVCLSRATSMMVQTSTPPEPLGCAGHVNTPYWGKINATLDGKKTEHICELGEFYGDDVRAVIKAEGAASDQAGREHRHGQVELQVEEMVMGERACLRTRGNRPSSLHGRPSDIYTEIHTAHHGWGWGVGKHFESAHVNKCCGFMLRRKDIDSRNSLKVFVRLRLHLDSCQVHLNKSPPH